MSRLAYLGTPEMAVPPLRALVEAGHDVVLCVTRPDRRRGRGGATTPSPVKAAATELGVPVSHELHDLATAGVELAVVVAYGRIIPARAPEPDPDGEPALLAPAALARRRAASSAPSSPATRETGVCLMKVEEGLDTGPVYAVRAVPIDDDEHARASCGPSWSTWSCALLVEALADGVAGLPDPEPQQGEVDDRGRRSRRRTCSSTGRAPPSSSGASCASAGPGRPSAAGD